MRLNKASLCLSALLVLGGCPGPDPVPNPNPDPQLNAIKVTCESATAAAGETVKCTASATDEDNNPFTVSDYQWTSTPASVATVDSTGTVTTRAVGAATISASATAGGVTKQGDATLTIQGTLHGDDITANETWRAADNPHVVRGQLRVIGPNNPTLTLEAGVEIRFGQDAELRVIDGALKAMGTEQAPIRMVARPNSPPKGYWRCVVFAGGGSASEMNHVTLSDCGRDSGEGACIALENKVAPVLRNVTVRNSSTMGVVVADDGSAFGTGSTTLSVSGSGSYAMHIGANQADTLPAGGTFTSNAPDAIELEGNVSRSQTWPNLGIPYVVNDHVNVESATSPRLTLSAGTVLRFGRDYGLYVGGDFPGELIVDGTAASPILLTADSASPTPGHWRGVHLKHQSSGTSRISHATIEYAGASGSVGTGNLNVYGNFGNGGARPVINNVVVQKGSEYGAYVVNDGAFGPGSTVLTARDNGSYAIGVEPNYVGSIPTGGTFSGNTPNAVEIPSGRVITTQTWPNLRIPYVVNGLVNVSSATTPKLTLLPGTELRFGQGQGLSVGAEGQPGILLAEGTSEEPIRFVPNALTPTKGHWRGLHFWYARGSLLDHVLVTHAGAAGSIGTGNLNVYREIDYFVVNSTLSDSSGCGLTVSEGHYADSTPVTTDHTKDTNLTIINNEGGTVCKN
jgi:hypothetical protein